MILACCSLAIGLWGGSPPPPFWRQPDSAGRACYSCHSPDGIELSAYRFGREDLIRRAAKHLPPDGQTQLAEAILARKIEALDPFRDRPFQPGGSALAAPSAPERDALFLDEVARKLPTFSQGTIDSPAKAAKARNALLQLNLHDLRIGITMNRLSEDGFHGSAHATLAHWLPDIPVADEKSLPAQDAYLANPSENNLKALDEVVSRGMPQDTPLRILALAKYRSLLVLQHYLRTGHYAPLPDGNPFWVIGETARTSESFSGSQLGLPQDVLEAKSAGPAFPKQLSKMKLPWYWLGWIADPSLQHSGGLRETRRADYFTQSLLEERYPNHALFMLSRKLAEQAKERHFEIQYSFLLLNQPLIDLEPKDPSRKKTFRRLASNFFRAMLYGLDDDVRRTGECVFRASQLLQVRQIDRYLTSIGDRPAALLSSLTARLESAKEIRERSQ